ncbi:hypothetical protein SCUCBS95973_005948 [Sporothrix curviconia]|uniref:Uncharacterized protein n=1 Tax=Sporothrix curviconia TaxID=1260050 RepID=A0ABP0C317_9PEZI
MGKGTSNPTVRILMLGAAGVGKNCLESRFTTMTYPPPYNPALTLNSRRYFTLPPIHAAGDCEEEDRESDKKDAVVVTTEERPGTSSTGGTPPSPSSPSSPHRPAAATTNVAVQVPEDTASLDDRTLVASSVGTSLCSACARENNTYLVEVINYPDLQSPAVRKQVHAKADYDAVLLVYDVTSSASFDSMAALHAEIPVCTRKNHQAHHRRAAPHASSTRSRTSGWFGGGGNETGTTGSGEIVVGLVGNRCDVDEDGDGEEDSGDEAGATTKAGPSTSTAAVTEDDLLHPLYRESILYEELMASRKAQGQGGKMKKDSTTDEQDNKDEMPLPDAIARMEASKNDDIHKWLQISRPTPPSLMLSADEPLLSPRPFSGSRASPVTVPTKTTTKTTTNPPSETAAKTPAKPRRRHRQVSPADGTMLAQALQLPVPFLETSAKTGHHVERALEQLVRAVLAEMGRDASGLNKAGKTCRHRVASQKGKSKENVHTLVLSSPRLLARSVASPRPKATAAAVPPRSPKSENIAAQRPASAAIFADAATWTDGGGGGGGGGGDEEVGVAVSTVNNAAVPSPATSVHSTHPASPVRGQRLPPPPPIQRRESVIGRMRKVFWRKSQQEQTADIAV